MNKLKRRIQYLESGMKKNDTKLPKGKLYTSDDWSASECYLYAKFLLNGLNPPPKLQEKHDLTYWPDEPYEKSTMEELREKYVQLGKEMHLDFFHISEEELKWASGID